MSAGEHGWLSNRTLGVRERKPIDLQHGAPTINSTSIQRDYSLL
jgi:hypothetical protein